MANEIVPKNALVVRTITGYGINAPEVGDIIKTIIESDDGRAYYKDLNSIPEGNWRYATALETYCFKVANIKATNITEITEKHKEQFKTYLKTQNHGNDEKNLPSVENARPNSTRPRAVGIRKPTKQVTITSRPIGNETKGKYLKKRIATVIVKTQPIKC